MVIVNIANRADGRCEYCQCPADFSTELFSIEHILPRSKEGLNDAENLAFSCSGCNIFKSDKTAFLDNISQQLQPLFHPKIVYDSLKILKKPNMNRYYLGNLPQLLGVLDDIIKLPPI